jgi:hypothetical protein
MKIWMGIISWGKWRIFEIHGIGGALGLDRAAYAVASLHGYSWRFGLISRDVGLALRWHSDAVAIAWLYICICTYRMT